MKNRILLLCLISVQFIVISPAGYSQGFTVGGRIGMGLSTLSNWDDRSSGSDKNKRSTLVGLQGCLTAKYSFSDLLGLQAELQFIQKGETNKFIVDSDTTYKSKTILNYLTLPVLLSASHSFNEILIYGNVGPYFGLGLEDNLRTFDMGICLGAGVGYHLGPGNVILDIRYDLGFMDIYVTPDEYKGTNYKATKNRTLGISVGYVIPLGQQ